MDKDKLTALFYGLIEDYAEAQEAWIEEWSIGKGKENYLEELRLKIVALKREWEKSI